MAAAERQEEVNPSMEAIEVMEIIKYPFFLKWEIPEYELEKFKNSINGFIKSPIFEASTIPRVKYNLTIYPNGDTNDRRGRVGLFLSITELGNMKNAKAKYTYSVESANYQFELNGIDPRGWGTSLCTTNSLFLPSQKFIVDKKLTIKCEGIFSFEKDPIDEEAKWCHNDLGYQMWKKDDNKDFIIEVEVNEIEVHKDILAARSPVFDRMFKSGMKEAIENKVKITDFNFEVVKIAMELCYNRKVSTLTLDEKILLLDFLDKYDIQKVKTSIEDSLLEDVSVTTVCRLANLSIENGLTKLEEKCAEFIFESIKENAIVDFDILDKDFAFKILKKSFFKTIKS